MCRSFGVLASKDRERPPLLPLWSYRVVVFISMLINIKNQQKVYVENWYNVQKGE